MRSFSSRSRLKSNTLFMSSSSPRQRVLEETEHFVIAHGAFRAREQLCAACRPDEQLGHLVDALFLGELLALVEVEPDHELELLFQLMAKSIRVRSLVIMSSCEGGYEVMSAVAAHDPPSVRALVPDMPLQLSDLIGRMLAKHPTERPQNCDAVAEELEAADPENLRIMEVTKADQIGLPGGEIIWVDFSKYLSMLLKNSFLFFSSGQAVFSNSSFHNQSLIREVNFKKILSTNKFLQKCFRAE